MSVKEAYSEWSATYDVDRNLTRDLDRQVTRESLEHLHCKSIVEIGCGTGKNTPLLAKIAEKVLAIDFSQAMTDKAKEKIQADNVTFSVADVTGEWPCADQSADLIVCNLVLEHVADLSFIFSEAFRCLGSTRARKQTSSAKARQLRFKPSYTTYPILQRLQKRMG